MVIVLFAIALAVPFAFWMGVRQERGRQQKIEEFDALGREEARARKGTILTRVVLRR